MFATQLALIISSTSLALFYITSGWGRILNVVFLILAGFASGGTSGTTLSTPPSPPLPPIFPFGFYLRHFEDTDGVVLHPNIRDIAMSHT